MNKAIFLDRDGTINVEKNYLHKIEDFVFLPGSVEAMRILQNAGYSLIIITNQSGIGRGYYSEDDFLKLNAWMLCELLSEDVRIEKVFYCPHLPDAKIIKYRKDCTCRKPGLSLFYNAVEEFKLNLAECYAIGDKLRDCAICLNSDCKGYLIGENESEEIIQQVNKGVYKGVKRASSLYDAAIDIVNAR